MSKVIKWWLLTAVCGFAAFISAFQINSAFADKHHINWLWWVSTFVCGIAAIYCFFYKVTKYANTSGDQER